MRSVTVILCLLLGACMPSTPTLELPQDCRSEYGSEELLASHWLLDTTTWRMRQTALLEIGHRKMALQGFLRLDLKNDTARLVAMNELGLVLFDLTVTTEGEQLQRALPQLEKIDGFASGIGRSLRQVFLTPRPHKDDRLQLQDNSFLLIREGADDETSYLFDCRGDLRETRWHQQDEGWRVIYNQYRAQGPNRLPGEIILNDYRYGIKLTLAVQEAKQEL